MSNRPSTLQLEALVEFLEQHPAVARGFLRTAQGKQECKKKWSEIALSLNSLGGVIKDGPAWAKYWAEKKCALKKQCAQNAASMRQTGGGSGNSTVLSELDKRLVAVMGGSCFASGDSEVAVNPFPTMYSVPEVVEEVPSFPIIIEEIPSPLLQQPQAENPTEAQDVAPAAVPPQSHSTAANRTRRRLRRTLSTNLDTEIDRMARIEERRVEAERLSAQAFADSAQAFADTSQRLDRLAAANEGIAVAITAVANALEKIANNLAR